MHTTTTGSTLSSVFSVFSLFLSLFHSYIHHFSLLSIVILTYAHHHHRESTFICFLSSLSFSHSFPFIYSFIFLSYLYVILTYAHHHHRKYTFICFLSSLSFSLPFQFIYSFIFLSHIYCHPDLCTPPPQGVHFHLGRTRLPDVRYFNLFVSHWSLISVFVICRSAPSAFSYMFLANTTPLCSQTGVYHYRYHDSS